MQTIQTEKKTITDLFGNTIEVTDLNAAISQAAGGKRVELINQSPFYIDEKGNSWPIKGREQESVLVSQYWGDAYTKLKLLKEDKKLDVVLTCNLHTFDDFDVLNHPLITRAKVPHSIKKGEGFNVYYGQSSKTAVKWKGNVITSLLENGLTAKGFAVKTQVKRRPLWHHVVGEHALKELIAEQTKLGYNPIIDTAYNADLYHIELTVKGKTRPKIFTATSLHNNKHTTVDDIQGECGISEYKPRNSPSVLNVELEAEMKRLINDGIYQSIDFVKGYSFTLVPYQLESAA